MAKSKELDDLVRATLVLHERPRAWESLPAFIREFAKQAMVVRGSDICALTFPNPDDRFMFANYLRRVGYNEYNGWAIARLRRGEFTLGSDPGRIDWRPRCTPDQFANQGEDGKFSG